MERNHHSKYKVNWEKKTQEIKLKVMSRIINLHTSMETLML